MLMSGTGKSFVGALIAKILHDFTSETILVSCYTNHALDQFLEDLMDIGIPQNNIVRLGGKSTARTEPLSLYNQKMNCKFGRGDWAVIDELKTNASDALDNLRAAFVQLMKHNSNAHELMDHIQFEDPEFHSAFVVPADVLTGDMQRVGKRGKKVDEWYLIMQWIDGRDAGIFKNEANVRDAARIWGMAKAERRAKVSEWRDAILKEQVQQLYDFGKVFNEYQEKLVRKFAENEATTLRSKRIIGCTTTAAAKYSEDLRAANPKVLLVEEAGEILESHVLTALGKETDRLILIGDHKYVLHYLFQLYIPTLRCVKGSSARRSTITASRLRRAKAMTSIVRCLSASFYAGILMTLSASSIACGRRSHPMYDG